MNKGLLKSSIFHDHNLLSKFGLKAKVKPYKMC